MAKTIRYTIMLIVATVFATVSSAQQPEQDRDPFFSDGPRTAGTASVAPDTAWGRDPFSRPFEGTATTAPTARLRGKNLTGILYSKDTRLAIIGG
jgi:hypothetical protein